MGNRIKLLISPKNIAEAKTTIDSNVDYIDCKNPDEGSLGANFPWIIRQMKELIPKESNQLLSATIGDFPNLPGSASLAALGAAVSGADIIKVGLKGPNTKIEGINLMEKVVKAVKDYNEDIQIVAAGYADQSRVKLSLRPSDIPEIASKSGADIAMLDTFIKDEKGLFDFLSVEELLDFKRKSEELNLEIALAGNIKKKDLSTIKKISPHILGVRSLVCEGFNRNNGSIKAELINILKKELYH